MKARTSLVVILLLTISLASIVFGLWKRQDKKETRTAAAASVTHAREERTAALFDVAPAPLPTTLPMRGGGFDSAGYPKAHVDLAAMRSLLWHRKFTELTSYFETLQKDFEDDPKQEAWPQEAMESFASADTALDPKLDAWAQATPNSFAPYLARGAHLVQLAYRQRGAGYAADIQQQDLAAMQATLNRASQDLGKALALRPKIMAATRLQIRVAEFGGSRAAEQAIFEQGAKKCPTCFGFRSAYLMGLTPRWGGSYPRMQAFVDKLDVSKNPRFKLLQGYIDYDQADSLMLAKKYDEALTAINRALTFGESSMFLLERARIYSHKDDLKDAIADAERSLSINESDVGTLADLAIYDSREKRWLDAAPLLLNALRIDPTDPNTRYIHPFVVQGLVRIAWEKNQSGDRLEALRIYDLAAELAPEDPDVRGRRVATILGPGTPDIPALSAAAQKNPDDFRAHQQLDYALSTQNRYPEIADMWTEYLTHHPDDARAYLERGGTYHHLNRVRDSRDDAARACDMGLNEGCDIVTRLDQQIHSK